MIGAGTIGQLIAQVLMRAAGARTVLIVDPDRKRLQLAERLAGAEIATPDEAPEVFSTAPQPGFDVIFECSGAPSAVTTALKAIRRQGTVCQVGTLPNTEVPVNLASLEIKEARYVGTFRFNDEIDDAIVLLAEHPEIAGVITHVLPAEQAAEAFAVARDSAKSGKVVVSLWTEPANG